jgi:DNA repair protein RadC
MTQRSTTQTFQADLSSNNLADFSLWEGDAAPANAVSYSHAQISQASLRIKDLPPSERPRDRLLEQGAKPLSTGELLSILLGTGQGNGKLSAVGLGQHILQTLSDAQQDPLNRLRDISVQELMTVSGVGIAKAATIVAAIELGKRIFCHRPPIHTAIDDPATAVAVLASDLMWQQQEQFAVLLLDVKHRLLGSRVISIGTATETLAHPRDIFRDAIRKGATRVIVAHNHPSGNVEPSPEDLALTRQLLHAGQILDIPVLDHLILGSGNHCSLRSTTTLWQEFPQEDHSDTTKSQTKFSDPSANHAG